jgi:hypothetical protein
MILRRVEVTVNRVTSRLQERVNDTASFVSAHSGGRVGQLYHQVGSTHSCLEADCVKTRNGNRIRTFEVTGDVFVSVMNTV